MWFLVLALLVLCLSPVPSLAAPAHVQSNQATFSAGSTIVVGFSGNTTTGNHLIFEGGWGGGPTLSGVSGSVSGAFTCPAGAKTSDGANDWAAGCYKENVTGGSDSITLTASGTMSFGSIAVGEYSGVATASSLDQANATYQTAVGTSANAITTPSVTTTTSGQLIVAMAAAASGPTTITAGTGFTCRQGLYGFTCGTADTIYEDQVQGSAGSIAATWTNNSGTHNFISTIMTFKAAVVGTTGPPMMRLNLGGGK